MTVPLLDIHKILKRLPHRYPILLVDRVLEIEKGVRIEDFRIDNVRRRIATRGDLWKPLLSARERVDLGTFMTPAVSRTGRRPRPTD